MNSITKKIIQILIVLLAIIVLLTILYGIEHLLFSKPEIPSLIKERTAPVAKVAIAQPTTPATSNTAVVTANADIGKKIVETKCIICHGTGVAGAPKYGDAAAWKPRLAKGMPTLFSHVKNGFNAMPPKGTCAECSDADLQAALEYMTKQ